MKILVDSLQSPTAEDDLRSRIREALDLLEQELPEGAFRKIANLVAVLEAHTSLSHLTVFSARRLADLFRSFFDFLDSRRTETAVDLLPLEEDGLLLLTNCNDAPFLLDSLQSLATSRNLRFQVISHPLVTVRRRQGKIVSLGDLDIKGPRESFIILELEGIDVASAESIRQEALRTMDQVLKVARDQKSLMNTLKMLEEKSGLQNYRDLWAWLQKGNFQPLSYRCLEVEKQGEDWMVGEREDSSLGIQATPHELHGFHPLTGFDAAFQDRLLREGPVVAEEIDRISPVNRPDRLVYLGFREGEKENSWIEHAFLGLFSTKSTDELVFNVPPLRRKIEDALQALWIPPGCHDFRKTVEIFNTFPKVELFFMQPDELKRTVRSFTLLYRQGAVKVVAARSLAVRGMTLLIIMPREFYTEENLERIETVLRRYFRVDSAKSRIIHISPDYLSLHVTIRSQTEEVRFDSERLETALTNVARPWELKLRLLLERSFGERKGLETWQDYKDIFSREYRTFIHPRFALRDIRNIEKVIRSGEEIFDLWGPFLKQEEFYRLQFYSPQESYLNELMPLLENLDLCVIDEVDFSLTAKGREVFIKSFAVRETSGRHKLGALRKNLLPALVALRRGEVENDFLNRLLTSTGLSWREVDVFRGYRNYYFQLGSPFTKRRVAFALADNPDAALLLFRYFEARFQPEKDGENLLRREEETLSPIRQEIGPALEAVEDINQDRILRILFNLIDSTVRSNFFLRRESQDYFFSFKISAIGIIDMPAPRPMYEIYVHSADMEGIHLRGGKIARGGIRWSDRPDDFRTEILSLMKTQMTKNALIVPVGSKGGFVVKTPFTSREKGAELSKAAYQTLMKGLLDITDNRVGGEVVRPEGVVAFDDEDPYLVVAADKGTAHLSDTANAVSREYDFWLGDAFASGGSHGYDHKKLGITARGAWECVKRHFRELGKDIQSEPFTVIGIGDMSGDVFGNGMLLSRQIRLLAAFDHRHIFLDPDPDPEVSFRERQRLFGLPRSSWDDYDRSIISSGGGIFSRHSKAIPLSPEIRDWLGTRHTSTDPQTLIRMILGAEAEMLWNGGIGTYVKASHETHEEVGDRAGDPLRVDGAALQVRVVGEGGNLGFTQKGRIEFALRGGRINTDAVDNSGGVDCSDHEVNLKILMQHLGDIGKVKSQEERDRLLEKVTDPVCEAVLANNYGQSLCLSLDALRCAEDVEPFLELADRLSNAGLLDRESEFVPKSREILARSQRAFTTPELAILLAYAKMHLYQALLESDLPNRDGVRDYLFGYFPGEIRERFGEDLPLHPLAREITATSITNVVVDHAGSAFALRLSRSTGASPVEVVAAYLALDSILNGPEIRQSLYGLDNRIPAARQYAYLLRVENTLATLCRWALERHIPIIPDQEVIRDYSNRCGTFMKTLGSILKKEEWGLVLEECARLEKEGLPEEIARKVSLLPYLKNFLPVATLVSETEEDFFSVASVFQEVREFLGIDEIFQGLESVSIRDRWDRMARHALESRFGSAVFLFTRAVFNEADGNPEAYFTRKRRNVGLYRNLRESLRGTPANFHPYTVLAGELEGLLDSSPPK